jgi:hypothetical protein
MNDILEGEVMDASATAGALAQITKAEIDQQIATAHAYPRSIARFQKRALEMVTLDEETAESCIYSRPVGKNQDGTQKYAEGLSIRTAEIVGACYGNLRVGATIIEMTPRYVKARGFAHDLETNFASTSEVIESTVDRYGKPYSERQRVVVAKAALSKARRDATFSVVPKALCKPLEAAARKTAIGDATTLDRRRTSVMAWVKTLGIDPARVFSALGIEGESDIGLEHLTTLTGLRTAIKEGDATIDETFPPMQDEKQSAAASAAAAAAAKAAEKARAKTTEQQPAEDPAAKQADAAAGAPPAEDKSKSKTSNRQKDF